MVDVWDASLNAQAFTHYTPTDVARLDRIYVSDSIRKNNQGFETLAAPFTDHLAVLLRVQLSIPFTHRERGRWCMNTSYLAESHFRDKLKIEWTEWKKHIPRYHSIIHWWEHCVKRMVKILFTREGTERNAYRNRMENFFYEATYDVLQEPIQHNQKITVLKTLKAKIARLNNISRQKLMIDAGDEDRILGETPSLHHTIKARKRQESRKITQICDDHGTIQTTSRAITKTFKCNSELNSNPSELTRKALSSYWIACLKRNRMG